MDKQELESPARQSLEKLQDNCTTRSSLQRSLYTNGLVTPYKSPDSSYLVRINSTSSFNFPITPSRSPQCDMHNKPTSPQPDRFMTTNSLDLPITPPSPSVCIPRHILHKQTVFQTPGPLPRVKRKILCSNTLPTKAAKPSPVSPQRPLQRHNCELPMLEKVGKRNSPTTGRGLNDTNTDLVSICVLRESVYKELLRDWQDELNKQSDATIFVENIVDRVSPPVNFTYISSNRYALGVPDPSTPEVSSSLCGCECEENCGTKSSCCPSMAGVAFAYTRSGNVRVQTGTPIYECNSKCSCPPDCVNRVVQHGQQTPLTIFRTPNGRGWGVRSMQPIRAHSFVTEYVGEVITSEEAEKRGHLYDEQGATYLFDLDFDDDNSEFTIDAAKEGNISHFFNHSCQPNLVVYSVWIECLDKRLPRIAFFSRQKISSGEELTFDYHMNHNQYISVSPATHKKMCLCGADKCLGYYY
ncbi:histone-lysine N-methyltransferase SUV39H2-like [Halichondria panicea]|uniref:histone-lysine N-methyltransferase SUV39H2-like n=1 Tax=Halichondria panicea TaxID=6063 RepID=UPI00312BB298